MNIIHITDQASWKHAIEMGEYRADTLESEGFIHCCQPDQVNKVLEEWFPNAKDLILLEINPDRLKSTLVNENLDGGQELFPHIYGSINLDAVIAIKTI